MKNIKEILFFVKIAGATNSNDDFYKNFWRKVLVSSNHIISHLIQPKDLEILNYLVEITTNTLSENNSKGKIKRKLIKLKFDVK